MAGRQLAEEQRGLARGRLGRVRAVDHVLARLDREVAADAAGRRLERVGRADHLARGLDGVLALEHHRDDRPRGDEVDELAEERALGVLGVVVLGELAGDGHVPQGDDPQALALEAGDDLAGQRAGEGVGLDEDQRSLHGFLCSGCRVRRSAGRGRRAAASARRSGAAARRRGRGLAVEGDVAHGLGGQRLLGLERRLGAQRRLGGAVCAPPPTSARARRPRAPPARPRGRRPSGAGAGAAG